MKELPVVQPTRAPVRHLMLYLTEDCNLRCTYCFVKKSPRAMDLETARKTMDYILHPNISGEGGSIAVTFFGGEPFLAMEQMEFISDYAQSVAKKRGKRVHFCATTNATVAGRRVEKIVSELSMPLLVSLDGGEKAMESRPYLGGGSPYQAIKRNLEKLTLWSPQVIGRATYHPEALNLLENVLEVFGLGVSSLALCPVPESDWRGYEGRLEKAFQELADWFIDEALRGNFVALEITWQQLRRIHGETHGASRPSRPCGVGTSILGVDPDGNVMPCHRYLYRRNDWFGTVDSPVFPKKRELFLGLSSQDILGCDSCVAKAVCGGGCRYLTVSEGYDVRTGAHPGYCLNIQTQARSAYHIYRTLMEKIPAKFSRALHHYTTAAGNFGELPYQ